MQSKISEAEKFIREQLASGPKPFRSLIEASGFPERALQRAGKRLGIRRSRNGPGGAWIWSLPASARLFAPPPAKPAVDAEYLVQSTPAPAGGYTVNDALALAEQRFAYPLDVSIRNPASLEVGYGWSSRIFSSRGVVQETILDDFTPSDDVPYEHIAVHTMRMVDGRLRCAGQTLALERGQPPEFRDWHYSRPQPVVRKKVSTPE